MPYTGLATRVYKDALTVQWGNSIKSDIDAIGPHGIWAWAAIDISATFTATLLNSYNIASLVRNATGDYTVTFTTGFQTSNYAMFGSSRRNSSFAVVGPAQTAPYAPNSFHFVTQADGESIIDSVTCLIGFAGTGTGV